MKPEHKRRGAALVLASASLVGLVTTWEGMEYVPYQDIVGVWTVCGGVTGKHVIPGKVYSQAECRALTGGAIEQHGREFLACLAPAARDAISQRQYEAFASLTYNVGAATVCRSGKDKGKDYLIDLVNAGQFDAACHRLLAYNRAGGKVVQGLVNRRNAEHKLCLSS